MPRIVRIHFTGLGHQDARFPALTLDLRDAQGRAADSVIWAENGTGKSSLLSLFFSTYRPSQRLFLGKQAEGKARELGDYVRDRDLGFVVTEWDTTDDRAEASLLADGPRELLLVGQMLSWRGLDRSTGELRRLFFTLRPGRDVKFDSLPILGLAEPVPSFEAFREWLDAQQKAHPRLAVVHTTNQAEWREHLESNHLDPELFTFQLRMNEREGGINNLFNELKRDADFIHEFLRLGFDAATASEVRANLEAFLPKLRQRYALELQLEFNQKLLVDLGLFGSQLAVWQAARTRGEQAELAAGALWAALVEATRRLAEDIARLEEDLAELETNRTRLESARTSNGRKQSFYRRRKAELEMGEAEADLRRWQQEREAAQRNKRLIDMAVLLGEMQALEADIEALKAALQREQEQARPVLETLERLGAAYKFQVERAIDSVTASRSGVQGQREALRSQIKALGEERTALVAEQSTKQLELETLGQHFALRETHRERLRLQGWLQAKQAAGDALARWQQLLAKARETELKAGRELGSLRAEQAGLAAEAAQWSAAIAHSTGFVTQLATQLSAAEAEEERLATHEQMRAAIEAPMADLNLPQTKERLSERAASLFRQVLRLNVEGAEDLRAQASVDKQRLFPPHRDVEAVVEKLKAAGIRSATTAAQWLAFNLTESQAAAEFLAADPARFGGVMFDAAADGHRVPEALAPLRTEQLPVVVGPTPGVVNPPPAPSGQSVVLPRHAGGINYGAAQVEAEKLAGLIAARTQELESLNAQLNASKTLIDDLGRWLGEFGGAKLGGLREKLRGERQALQGLQERQQNNLSRQQGVEAAINMATLAEGHARQECQQGERAVAQLGAFSERFDADYDARRAHQAELGSRLQAIAIHLPEIESLSERLDTDERALERRSHELGVQLSGYQNEAAAIAYSGEPPALVAESLDQLRARYQADALQYTGRFLNTKAQGELTAKETAWRDKEQKLGRDFTGLDQNAARVRLDAGDLPGQLQSAEQVVSAAQAETGAAGIKLKQARHRYVDLGPAGEQERPGQGELIPATALEAANALAELESDYAQLQDNLEENRDAGQVTSENKARLSLRSKDFGYQADRLRDQNAPQTVPAIELPEDDAQVRAQTEAALQRLKRTRDETQAEHEKLKSIYQRIQEVTQEERFARAMNLPARSLFAHMPLDELVLTGAEKQKAVQEETLVLQADLEQMNQHRETLVESLLSVCEQAARLLHRAEKWSVLPDNMGEWAGEPFLRIRLRLSPIRADNLGRLKSLVDLLFTEGRIPPAIDLIFRGLTALVGETGVDATILKPETQRRRQRYPVRDMAGWSEGERTTVAILLYCTLVKIRAQSRGYAARRAEVSALLLDNPVGPCSKPEFLQMHRWIASQLGVQLIYATGVNDPAALSVFPNRVRLAKNRFIPATGELAVGVQVEGGESIIQDIRIFDGNGEDDRGPHSAPET